MIIKNIAKSIILFVIILFNSCISKEEPGVATVTTVFNTSGHDIEFQRFVKEKYISSEFVKNNESVMFNFPAKDGHTGARLPFFDINADSIRVYYYEEASIWHTKEENQVVSKSLLLKSSYKGGMVNDTRYEFTYTFTEDDFQEAVDFGD